MKVVKISEVPKKPYISSLLTGRDAAMQVLITDSKDYIVSVMNFGKQVRNKFHSHDSEQILIVTAGTGIVATEEEERFVTVGDVIFIPAGEKHWHGATKESNFSHIFIMRAGSRITQLED